MTSNVRYFVMLYIFAPLVDAKLPVPPMLLKKVLARKRFLPATRAKRAEATWPKKVILGESCVWLCASMRGGRARGLVP